MSGVQAGDCADFERTVCVMQNYPQSYELEREKFWEVLNNGRRQAEAAASVDPILEFLQVAILRSDTAELVEFISESVETLCIRKPELFIEPHRMLDVLMNAAVDHILANPMYFDAKELTCNR